MYSNSSEIDERVFEKIFERIAGPSLQNVQLYGQPRVVSISGVSG